MRVVHPKRGRPGGAADVKGEAHRAKAERLERSLAKCTAEDYEVVIDGAMLAVSHWANYAYHALGLTGPDTNVMHAYFVTAFDRQYFGLAAGPEFMDALEEIETLRPLYARGNVPGGPKAAARALALLAAVRAKALAITPSSR